MTWLLVPSGLAESLHAKNAPSAAPTMKVVIHRRCDMLPL
jgi:hypothetical protein